jgi:hypothetical protein
LQKLANQFIEIAGEEAMSERPQRIAKFLAGAILESALEKGYEAPKEYSPLKRARIENWIGKIAERLIRESGKSKLGKAGQNVNQYHN